MNFQLLPFLKTFFQEHQCQLLEESDDHIRVKLTETLDSVLMNRPFYWHYIKSTKQQGEPMSLTLTTNHRRISQGEEFIHFGSPRFQQIVNLLKEQESFTKLYEIVNTIETTPLFPWLLTNIKVTYKGLLLKEELFSIGLNLVNGFMRVNMMETLGNKQLAEEIADYCHTISPLITLENGYRRIEEVIVNYIKEQDHQWSELALKRMEQELAMVDYFFEKQNNQEQHHIEKGKIFKRYEPVIAIETISGGIIYLTESFHKSDQS